MCWTRQILVALGYSFTATVIAGFCVEVIVGNVDIAAASPRRPDHRIGLNPQLGRSALDVREAADLVAESPAAISSSTLLSLAECCSR